MNFIFASKLTYTDFHATCALLKDFEIFDNFDHIFTIILGLVRPVKVAMNPLGQKFEL